MPVQERPQLRPYLMAAPLDREGRYYLITDQLHLSRHTLRVSARELEWIQMFDGQHSLHDIQTEVTRHLGGAMISLEVFGRLVEQLDEAIFLEGARFRELVGQPIRSPCCLGSYEPEPDALRRQLERLFTGPGGAGLPNATHPEERFRAALLPHIDYGRGGRTYTWAFKEIFERSPARLFVIIGTSHYSPQRFTLTRKHFQTPLGVVPTDAAYVNRLAAHYGEGLFDDELMAHLPEHSIELEVVFLQYLYGDRPFRIVPLVVGSFHDAIEAGCEPCEYPDVQRMIAALRAVEHETSEPICYLISGDLAHIGPKFGDAGPLRLDFLAHSRRQDQAILKQAEAASAAGFFRVIADEGDGRRICGLPPTYLVLETVRPRHGKVLHYDQYVHPRGQESVSFTSMTFYR